MNQLPPNDAHQQPASLNYERVPPSADGPLHTDVNDLLPVFGQPAFVLGYPLILTLGWMMVGSVNSKWAELLVLTIWFSGFALCCTSVFNRRRRVTALVYFLVYAIPTFIVVHHAWPYFVRFICKYFE